MAKKQFPLAFEDEGGVSVLHIPTKEEMENCAFAQNAGKSCPIGLSVAGAPTPQRGCGACTFHPHIRTVRMGARFKIIRT